MRGHLGTMACDSCGEEIVFDKTTIGSELVCDHCHKTYVISKIRNQIIITDPERM